MGIIEATTAHASSHTINSLAPSMLELQQGKYTADGTGFFPNLTKTVIAIFASKMRFPWYSMVSLLFYCFFGEAPIKCNKLACLLSFEFCRKTKSNLLFYREMIMSYSSHIDQRIKRGN